MTPLLRPWIWPDLLALYAWWRAYGVGRRAAMRLTLAALKPVVEA